MSMRTLLSCAWAAALCTSLTSRPATAAPSANDLRQFRVGMPVSALPATGYQDFTCAAAPAHKLPGWAGYTLCPKDARGFHDVAFRFGPASNPEAYLGEDYRGTRVAGHPVSIALLISDGGIVDGIRIATDPSARLYLHKKAFLFADQVRAHYGEQDWRCTDRSPTGGQEPIGGVFIDRHCDKTTTTRRYLLDQQLFRKSGQPLEDFVSAAELTILLNSGTE